MTSLKPHGCAVTLLGLLLASPLVAQIKTTPSTSPRGITAQTPGNPRTRGARQEPCWKQVGVPHSAIERRRQIEENTRSQVQAVCNDSSLSPQQKREKIHQLREQAHQEVAALMTPQQAEAWKACRQQRAAARGERGGGGRGMHHGGGAGPCGEMSSGKHAPTPNNEEPEEP